MRRGVAASLTLAALAAGLATPLIGPKAQDAGPLSAPPAARPSVAGAADASDDASARPAARPGNRAIPAPAPVPAPVPESRATPSDSPAEPEPPGNGTPTDGREAADENVSSAAEAAKTDASTAAAEAADPPSAAPAAPVSQGRLIPPEEMPPPVPLAPPMPEQLRETDFDDAACRLALRLMGVGYQQSAPITDPGQRDCGIARPVVVTEILPGIMLDSPAPMRCDTARQMARWMTEIVVPAATHLPGAPRPVRLEMGSTYQCRGVVGGASAEKLSEHALGNAVDIAAFGFDDGSRLAITPPEDRGDMAVAFQNAVQASACLFFATVLGPGSNAAHDDHLHLDVKARRGGFRLCQ